MDDDDNQPVIPRIRIPAQRTSGSTPRPPSVPPQRHPEDS